MTHTHIHRILTDAKGNVLPSARVMVYDLSDGTLFTEGLYVDAESTNTATQPIVAGNPDGTLDLYLDGPADIQIRVTPSGGNPAKDEFVFENVILPATGSTGPTPAPSGFIHQNRLEAWLQWSNFAPDNSGSWLDTGLVSITDGAFVYSGAEGWCRLEMGVTGTGAPGSGTYQYGALGLAVTDGYHGVNTDGYDNVPFPAFSIAAAGNYNPQINYQTYLPMWPGRRLSVWGPPELTSGGATMAFWVDMYKAT